MSGPSVSSIKSRFQQEEGMTQSIGTVNERQWNLNDDDYVIRSRDRDKAPLSIWKGHRGKLHIYATGGKGTVSIGLEPDMFQSLLDWLKTYAQELAANGDDERAQPPLQGRLL
jgi:hypothetical protein